MKAIAPQEFKLVHRYTEHKSLKWHKQRDKQKVRDRKTWDIMALLTPDTDMHLMVLFQDRSFFMLIRKLFFTCTSNAPPVSTGFWGSQILWLFHTTNAVWSCVSDHLWSQIVIVSPEMDMNTRYTWSQTWKQQKKEQYNTKHPNFYIINFCAWLHNDQTK